MPDPASDAATLVAMNVADMSASLEGIDLATLQLALDAEAAKGDAARKGALAALQSAIDGHPELSVSAAVAADAPAAEPVPVVVEAAPIAAEVPQAESAAPEAVAETPAEQPTAEPEAATDPELAETITTVAEAEPAADDLEDEPADPDALSNAPARPHQTIVDQLEMRWFELVDFVRHIEGEAEGDIGDFLTFIRSKL